MGKTAGNRSRNAGSRRGSTGTCAGRIRRTSRGRPIRYGRCTGIPFLAQAVRENGAELQGEALGEAADVAVERLGGGELGDAVQVAAHFVLGHFHLALGSRRNACCRYAQLGLPLMLQGGAADARSAPRAPLRTREEPGG